MSTQQATLVRLNKKEKRLLKKIKEGVCFSKCGDIVYEHGSVEITKRVPISVFSIRKLIRHDYIKIINGGILALTGQWVLMKVGKVKRLTKITPQMAEERQWLDRNAGRGYTHFDRLYDNLELKFEAVAQQVFGEQLIMDGFMQMSKLEKKQGFIAVCQFHSNN